MKPSGRLLVLATLALLAGSMPAEMAQAGWRAAPVVPKIDRQIRGKLVATLQRGRHLGNRPDVFAKVGDSLSQSPAFAQGLGCGRWTAGPHSGLSRTVRLFSERRLAGASTYCSRVDSFSRDSAATLSGVASNWAVKRGAGVDPHCGPEESPLACEIRLTRPAYAVILLGANDQALAAALGGDPVPGFVASITRIVRSTRANGVVPILTSIPPPGDPSAGRAVESLNTDLYRLAVRLEVPVVNLWRALEPLPGHGLAADGIHLSVFGGPECVGPCDPNTCAPACQPANLTRAGLQYGYNVRNLITVQALSRLSNLERSLRHRRNSGD